MDNEQAMSFVATVKLDGHAVDFSYVKQEANLDLRQMEVGGYGYAEHYHEYLCVNTFSDVPVRLFFKYAGSHGYKLYVRNAGESGKHMGVTNNGYVWATDQGSRIRHFQLIGEDKSTVVTPDTLADTAKVYLRSSRNGKLLTTYSTTHVGKHWWCYLTDGGGPDAFFTLEISQRKVAAEK
ncbi:MAG: hypothetical protein JHC61_16295 [Burkholderiaceae bacterium]|nr:hypothetical protein [Burkholderiaceae bacterium]